MTWLKNKMVAYSVDKWIIWLVIAFFISLLFTILMLVISIVKIRRSDKILIVDKNNRWRWIDTKIKNKDIYNEGKNAYRLDPDAGLVSNKGKALFFFSEGKPTPLNIKYSKTSWLDSTSMNSFLTNNVIQKILMPKDKFLDIMIILAGVSSAISLIISAINLLIITGVIQNVSGTV